MEPEDNQKDYGVKPLLKIEGYMEPSEPIDILVEETNINTYMSEREIHETIPETVAVETDYETEPEIENVEDKYEREIPYIAKTVWGEARGCSRTEQAAVIWCILNRVDSKLTYMPNNIIDVITQEEQFLGYREEFPVTDSIRELTIDVLTRWELEKIGQENVGRILPSEYLWFYGDGRHNHFRNSFYEGTQWNWSLESPYN